MKNNCLLLLWSVYRLGTTVAVWSLWTAWSLLTASTCEETFYSIFLYIHRIITCIKHFIYQLWHVFFHHRPYVLEVAKIFQHGKSWLSFCSAGTDLDRGRSIRLLHYTTLLKCVYRSGEYCTTAYVGKKYCKVFCDSQGSCM